MDKSQMNLVRKVMQSEIFREMKQTFDQALVFAYGRATGQQKEPEQYAQRGNVPPLNGLDLALIALESTGYIQKDSDGIYVTTSQGKEYLEDQYGGLDGWQIRIASPHPLRDPEMSNHY